MRGRFDRVADLVEGFETPYGLELLSTIHWVVAKMGARTLEEVVAQTHDWNERKRRFTEKQIALAVKVLTAEGWIRPISGV
jgi:hypothetical protein